MSILDSWLPWQILTEVGKGSFPGLALCVSAVKYIIRTFGYQGKLVTEGSKVDLKPGSEIWPGGRRGHHSCLYDGRGCE